LHGKHLKSETIVEKKIKKMRKRGPLEIRLEKELYNEKVYNECICEENGISLCQHSRMKSWKPVHLANRIFARHTLTLRKYQRVKFCCKTNTFACNSIFN